VSGSELRRRSGSRPPGCCRGAGFVIGGWAFWTHRAWWEYLILGSALTSLGLEAIARVSVEPGPYASAAVFNTLAIILLLVPRTRHQLAQL